MSWRLWTLLSVNWRSKSTRCFSNSHQQIVCTNWFHLLPWWGFVISFENLSPSHFILFTKHWFWEPSKRSLQRHWTFDLHQHHVSVVEDLPWKDECSSKSLLFSYHNCRVIRGSMLLGRLVSCTRNKNSSMCKFSLEVVYDISSTFKVWQLWECSNTYKLACISSSPSHILAFSGVVTKLGMGPESILFVRWFTFWCLQLGPYW